MNDLNCPYCEHPLNINHDDGFGYAEDELHEMDCRECEKRFIFTTSIIFYYEPIKADCLNGSPHDFQKTHTMPAEYATIRCTVCEAAQ